MWWWWWWWWWWFVWLVGFYRCFWGMINIFCCYEFGRLIVVEVPGCGKLIALLFLVMLWTFVWRGVSFFVFPLLLLEFCLFVDFLIGCCFVICGFFVWVIYSVGGNGVFTCFQILDTKTPRLKTDRVAFIFIFHTLTVVLSLEKWAYSEIFHVVYCHVKPALFFLTVHVFG